MQIDFEFWKEQREGRRAEKRKQRLESEYE